MKPLILSLLLLGSLASRTWGQSPTPLSSKSASPWHSVEKSLGREGIEQGELFKISFPRTDLNVVVKGVPLEPEMALTSWFTFTSQGKEAQVQGDLVVLDQEAPKVLTQLVRQEFEIIALYSPLLNESPNVKTIHISGHGSRSNLARGLKAVLSATGTPLEKPSTPTPEVTPNPISVSSHPATPTPSASWSEVEAVLGPGQPLEKLLRYVYARAETITQEGREIPPLMGVATSFTLQREGNRVAATGDFVLTAEEVRPVVESLTLSHIVVTAFHNDLLHESPQLFFLHFWALGESKEVAKGLRAALEKVHLAEPR